MAPSWFTVNDKKYIIPDDPTIKTDAQKLHFIFTAYPELRDVYGIDDEKYEQIANLGMTDHLVLTGREKLGFSNDPISTAARSFGKGAADLYYGIPAGILSASDVIGNLISKPFIPDKFSLDAINSEKVKKYEEQHGPIDLTRTENTYSSPTLEYMQWLQESVPAYNLDHPAYYAFMPTSTERVQKASHLLNPRRVLPTVSRSSPLTLAAAGILFATQGIGAPIVESLLAGSLLFGTAYGSSLMSNETINTKISELSPNEGFTLLYKDYGRASIEGGIETISDVITGGLAKIGPFAKLGKMISPKVGLYLSKEGKYFLAPAFTVGKLTLNGLLASGIEMEEEVWTQFLQDVFINKELQSASVYWEAALGGFAGGMVNFHAFHTVNTLFSGKLLAEKVGLMTEQEAEEFVKSVKAARDKVPVEGVREEVRYSIEQQMEQVNAKDYLERFNNLMKQSTIDVKELYDILDQFYKEYGDVLGIEADIDYKDKLEKFRTNNDTTKLEELLKFRRMQLEYFFGKDGVKELENLDIFKAFMEGDLNLGSLLEQFVLFTNNALLPSVEEAKAFRRILSNPEFRIFQLTKQYQYLPEDLVRMLYRLSNLDVDRLDNLLVLTDRMLKASYRLYNTTIDGKDITSDAMIKFLTEDNGLFMIYDNAVITQGVYRTMYDREATLETAINNFIKENEDALGVTFGYEDIVGHRGRIITINSTMTEKEVDTYGKLLAVHELGHAYGNFSYENRFLLPKAQRNPFYGEHAKFTEEDAELFVNRFLDRVVNSDNFLDKISKLDPEYYENLLKFRNSLTAEEKDQIVPTFSHPNKELVRAYDSLIEFQAGGDAALIRKTYPGLFKEPETVADLNKAGKTALLNLLINVIKTHDSELGKSVQQLIDNMNNPQIKLDRTQVINKLRYRLNKIGDTNLAIKNSLSNIINLLNNRQNDVPINGILANVGVSSIKRFGVSLTDVQLELVRPVSTENKMEDFSTIIRTGPKDSIGGKNNYGLKILSDLNAAANAKSLSELGALFDFATYPKNVDLTKLLLTAFLKDKNIRGTVALLSLYQHISIQPQTRFIVRPTTSKDPNLKNWEAPKNLTIVDNNVVQQNKIKSLDDIEKLVTDDTSRAVIQSLKQSGYTVQDLTDQNKGFIAYIQDNTNEIAKYQTAVDNALKEIITASPITEAAIPKTMTTSIGKLAHLVMNTHKYYQNNLGRLAINKPFGFAMRIPKKSEGVTENALLNEFWDALKERGYDEAIRNNLENVIASNNIQNEKVKNLIRSNMDEAFLDADTLLDIIYTHSNFPAISELARKYLSQCDKDHLIKREREQMEQVVLNIYNAFAKTVKGTSAPKIRNILEFDRILHTIGKLMPYLNYYNNKVSEVEEKLRKTLTPKNMKLFLNMYRKHKYLTVTLTFKYQRLFKKFKASFLSKVNTIKKELDKARKNNAGYEAEYSILMKGVEELYRDVTQHFETFPHENVDRKLYDSIFREIQESEFTEKGEKITIKELEEKFNKGINKVLQDYEERAREFVRYTAKFALFNHKVMQRRIHELTRVITGKNYSTKEKIEEYKKFLTYTKNVPYNLLDLAGNYEPFLRKLALITDNNNLSNEEIDRMIANINSIFNTNFSRTDFRLYHRLIPLYYTLPHIDELLKSLVHYESMRNLYKDRVNKLFDKHPDLKKFLKAKGLDSIPINRILSAILEDKGTTTDFERLNVLFKTTYRAISKEWDEKRRELLFKLIDKVNLTGVFVSEKASKQLQKFAYSSRPTSALELGKALIQIIDSVDRHIRAPIEKKISEELLNRVLPNIIQEWIDEYEFHQSELEELMEIANDFGATEFARFIQMKLTDAELLDKQYSKALSDLLAQYEEEFVNQYLSMGYDFKGNRTINTPEIVQLIQPFVEIPYDVDPYKWVDENLETAINILRNYYHYEITNITHENTHIQIEAIVPNIEELIRRLRTLRNRIVPRTDYYTDLLTTESMLAKAGIYASEKTNIRKGLKKPIEVQGFSVARGERFRIKGRILSRREGTFDVKAGSTKKTFLTSIKSAFTQKFIEYRYKKLLELLEKDEFSFVIDANDLEANDIEVDKSIEESPIQSYLMDPTTLNKLPLPAKLLIVATKVAVQLDDIMLNVPAHKIYEIVNKYIAYPITDDATLYSLISSELTTIIQKLKEDQQEFAFKSLEDLTIEESVLKALSSLTNGKAFIRGIYDYIYANELAQLQTGIMNEVSINTKRINKIKRIIQNTYETVPIEIGATRYFAILNSRNRADSAENSTITLYTEDEIEKMYINTLDPEHVLDLLSNSFIAFIDLYTNTDFIINDLVHTSIPSSVTLTREEFVHGNGYVLKFERGSIPSQSNLLPMYNKQKILKAVSDIFKLPRKHHYLDIDFSDPNQLPSYRIPEKPLISFDFHQYDTELIRQLLLTADLVDNPELMPLPVNFIGTDRIPLLYTSNKPVRLLSAIRTNYNTLPDEKKGLLFLSSQKMIHPELFAILYSTYVQIIPDEHIWKNKVIIPNTSGIHFEPSEIEALRERGFVFIEDTLYVSDRNLYETYGNNKYVLDENGNKIPNPSALFEILELYINGIIKVKRKENTRLLLLEATSISELQQVFDSETIYRTIKGTFAVDPSRVTLMKYVTDLHRAFEMAYEMALPYTSEFKTAQEDVKYLLGRLKAINREINYTTPDNQQRLEMLTRKKMKIEGALRQARAKFEEISKSREKLENDLIDTLNYYKNVVSNIPEDSTIDMYYQTLVEDLRAQEELYKEQLSKNLSEETLEELRTRMAQIKGMVSRVLGYIIHENMTENGYIGPYLCDIDITQDKKLSVEQIVKAELVRDYFKKIQQISDVDLSFLIGRKVKIPVYFRIELPLTKAKSEVETEGISISEETEITPKTLKEKIKAQTRKVKEVVPTDVMQTLSGDYVVIYSDNSEKPITKEEVPIYEQQIREAKIKAKKPKGNIQNVIIKDGNYYFVYEDGTERPAPDPTTARRVLASLVLKKSMKEGFKMSIKRQKPTESSKPKVRGVIAVPALTPLNSIQRRLHSEEEVKESIQHIPRKIIETQVHKSKPTKVEKPKRKRKEVMDEIIASLEPLDTTEAPEIATILAESEKEEPPKIPTSTDVSVEDVKKTVLKEVSPLSGIISVELNKALKRIENAKYLEDLLDKMTKGVQSPSLKHLMDVHALLLKKTAERVEATQSGNIALANLIDQDLETLQQYEADLGSYFGFGLRTFKDLLALNIGSLYSSITEAINEPPKGFKMSKNNKTIIPQLIAVDPNLTQKVIDISQEIIENAKSERALATIGKLAKQLQATIETRLRQNQPLDKLEKRILTTIFNKGGKISTQDLAEALYALNRNKRRLGYITAYLLTNQLSNPEGRKVDFVSNFLSLLWNVYPKRVGQIIFDSLAEKIYNARGKPYLRKYFVKDLATNPFIGLKEGLINGWLYATFKIDREHFNTKWMRELNSLVLGSELLAKYGSNPFVKGLGYGLSFVPRLLSAIDVVVKSCALNYARINMETSLQYHIDKKKMSKEEFVKLLTDDIFLRNNKTPTNAEYKEVFNALKENPYAAFTGPIEAFANQVVFQEPAKGVIRGLISLRDTLDESIANVTGLPIPLGRLMYPFIAIPFNLAKFAMRLQPIAVLSPFGIGFNPIGAITGVFGAKALFGDNWVTIATNQLIGAFLSYIFGWLLQAGWITGPPPETEEEKEIWRNLGIRPYSFVVKDPAGNPIYISIPEPFNSALIPIIDQIYYIMRKPDLVIGSTEHINLLRKLYYNTYKSLIDNTAFGDLLAFNFGLSDPLKGLRIGRMAQSLLPASSFFRFLNQTMRIQNGIQRSVEIDYTIRDVFNDPSKIARAALGDTYGENLVAMFGQFIPGFEKGIPERFTIYGKSYERSHLVADIMGFKLPLEWFWLGKSIAPEQVSPVDKEFFNLGIYPSIPSKYSVFYGQKVDLTEEQYRSLCLTYGNLIMKFMGNLINSPKYRQLGYEQKLIVVDRLLDKAKEYARKIFIAQYPEIRIQQVQKAIENPVSYITRRKTNTPHEEWE